MRPGATFPSNYPTSCLLGSVDVTDWLAQVDLAPYNKRSPYNPMPTLRQIVQEEYREAHLDGESQSPYVAICTNPQVDVFQRTSLITFYLYSGVGR